MIFGSFKQIAIFAAAIAGAVVAVQGAATVILNWFAAGGPV